MPAHPLMDTRLGIAVEGAAHNSRIEIDARTQAQDGMWWRSAAHFVADAQGRVDLDHKAEARFALLRFMRFRSTAATSA